MPDETGNMVGEEKQFVVFSLGNEEFGVNIGEVREIIKMETITRIPNTEQYIKGVINLRGGIIVIIDLAMKLGFPKKVEDKDTRIIVIEEGNNTVGMIVDNATEVLRVNSNQMKPAPPILVQKINANYIEGVGIIDERLLIILDLAKVLESKGVIQAVNNAESPSITQVKTEEIKEEKEESKIESKTEPINTEPINTEPKVEEPIKTEPVKEPDVKVEEKPAGE
jgi:purine-binding chemotaxis protein CheW